MLNLVRFAAAAALLTTMTFTAVAQESAKKKEKRKGPKAPSVVDRTFALPDSLQLTDDQKAKVAEIKKEYAAKLTAAQEKVNEVFTPEQRREIRQATRSARDAGKKAAPARRAAINNVGLTAEQQEKLNFARQESAKLQTEARNKISQILTDEQKSKLPPLPSQEKSKSKGKKKKTDAQTS